MGALAVSAAAGSAATKLTAVSRANLCVTEGVIEELPSSRLSVDTSKMRAYVNATAAQSVEARFTYVGPTASDAPLGSGQIRRQFGLKLRAQDACNLVYAMWRFEPKSMLVVSLKRNPGQHTSAQCGNRGYRNISPRFSAPIPTLRPGDAHTLRAELIDAQLTIFVDNTLAWRGSVAPVAGQLDGAVGIRSDNVRLQIELRAPIGGQAGSARDCRPDAESSE
jgi:hypothetical protein